MSLVMETQGGVMGVFDDYLPKPYLRLRETGDGKWAIVRVRPYEQFGKEVVAKGLTRQQAEQMIALSKEE